MTDPFIVHSSAGQANVQASTMAEALRWQETLRGVIMRDGAVVVEAVAS